MAKRIEVQKHAGNFAENKDAAAKMREKFLIPALEDQHGDVVLDFAGVEYATQSFIHALLAKVIRNDEEALGRMLFKNCSEAVQGIVEIVVDYAQEAD